MFPGFLVELLIGCIVVGLLFWILQQIPLPPPIGNYCAGRAHRGCGHLADLRSGGPVARRRGVPPASLTGVQR